MSYHSFGHVGVLASIHKIDVMEPQHTRRMINSLKAQGSIKEVINTISVMEFREMGEGIREKFM